MKVQEQFLDAGKIPGCFGRIGAEPRVGLGSQGGIKKTEITMITAINTAATTISLKIKFGMVGTFSSWLAFVFIRPAGNYQAAGFTHPPEVKRHQNKKTGGNDCCVDGKENG